MAEKRLFQSFFMGGFECSAQRMPSGRRINMLASTGHARYAAADYALLSEAGILAARDGICWPLVEPSAGRYDFSGVLPAIRGARDAGVQVIWDLCHYGWPDDLDVFSAAFVERCAALARAFVSLLIAEGTQIPFIAPVNEISFLAWVAGEVGHFFPFTRERGDELKRQFVRAAIAAIAAIHEVAPGARIVHTDPIIHVAADPAEPELRLAAERYRQAQFGAWQMIGGQIEPELGGKPAYLDIIGLNYYPHNQWLAGSHGRKPIEAGHPLYRDFRHMLGEVYDIFGRPLFIAETSSLGMARPEWLRYIAGEARAAIHAGTPVEGLCIYPIVDAPDWNDEQIWHQGLWSAPDATGRRTLNRQLAEELRRL